MASHCSFKREGRQDSRRSQKIIEEVELQLENVKVKYDGIISKVGSIKDQAQRIEDVIVSKNKMDDMGVQNEGKPSNVKPYRHPHYQESFQERQEDDISTLPRKKME
jgi:hypothetical protein